MLYCMCRDVENQMFCLCLCECVCARTRTKGDSPEHVRDPVLVPKNDDYLPVFSPSPAVSDVLQQQKDRVSNP